MSYKRYFECETIGKVAIKTEIEQLSSFIAWFAF